MIDPGSLEEALRRLLEYDKRIRDDVNNPLRIKLRVRSFETADGSRSYKSPATMSSAQETRPADIAAEVDQNVVPVAITTTVTQETIETVVFGTLDDSAMDINAGGVGNNAAGGTLDGATGPVTIGEALETVASKIGDKPLTTSDARAIQSAEARATGVPTGVRGGPGATALSAVNAATGEADMTIGDVLADASAHLRQDKIVTPRDAAKVHSAEARNNDGRVEKGGVASTMQQAAAHNENIGFGTGDSA